MAAQEHPGTMLKIGSASILLIVGLFALGSMLPFGAPSASAVVSTAAAATAQPTSNDFASPTPDGEGYHYPTHNMVGWSATDVGRYAQQYAEDYHTHGAPTDLLLARSVTRASLAELGIECLSSLSIEDPPRVLVILKGNFDLGNLPGAARGSNRHYAYLALDFDLWAGAPDDVVGVNDSGYFRIALDDPAIPVPADGGGGPINCPVDLATKTRHYGGAFPTVMPGTPTIWPTQPPEPTLPPPPLTADVPVGTPVIPPAPPTGAVLYGTPWPLAPTAVSTAAPTNTP